MSTVTRDIEIGELFLATDWISFDTLAQNGKVSVEIDFDYEPEQREIMRPDPSDCQGYEPAQVRIQCIRLAKAAKFRGVFSCVRLKAGADIYEILDPGYRSDLEDEIKAAARVNDYDMEPA